MLLNFMKSNIIGRSRWTESIYVFFYWSNPELTGNKSSQKWFNIYVLRRFYFDGNFIWHLTFDITKNFTAHKFPSIHHRAVHSNQFRKIIRWFLSIFKNNNPKCVWIIIHIHGFITIEIIIWWIVSNASNSNNFCLDDVYMDRNQRIEYRFLLAKLTDRNWDGKRNKLFQNGNAISKIMDYGGLAGGGREFSICHLEYISFKISFLFWRIR